MSKIKAFFKDKSAKIAAGLMGIGGALLVGANAHADAYDYSSSSNVITDLTSGLKSPLMTGLTVVIGIGLTVWLVFFIIKKLRTTVR